MIEQCVEHDSVRHLSDLGYVDPIDMAMREATLRQQLDAEFQQAVSVAKQGLAAEAIRILERLKVDDPNWIAPHQLLAEIHCRVGHWDEGEKELQWLEHHAVESPRIAMLAAGLAKSRREFSVSRELLEYAAHVEPALAGVQSQLGHLLLRLGDHHRAREHFELAFSQNESDAQALDGLASLALIASDYESAANWALSALDNDIRAWRAHYHLGVALAMLLKPEEAMAAFEASARINPDCVATLYWMARISQSQLSDTQRADSYRSLGRQRLRERRQRTATTAVARAQVATPPVT